MEHADNIDQIGCGNIQHEIRQSGHRILACRAFAIYAAGGRYLCQRAINGGVDALNEPIGGDAVELRDLRRYALEVSKLFIA